MPIRPTRPKTEPPLRFELTPESKPIQHFLEAQEGLAEGESVQRVGLAGAGNMNRTLRVYTDQRSLILKQSFPYCAKFPDIPAPIDRIKTEVAFYDIAGRSKALAARMPQVIEFAPDHHLAMIEDLGAGTDLLSLYTGDSLREGELSLLGQFARELHSLAIPENERGVLRNHDMRALNHEHIFDIPLRKENGLDLAGVTAGLPALAEEFKRDDIYKSGVHALGQLYVKAEGPSLLHGDYYPGSFLRTDRGLAIIDPEFAFSGPPEFDLSVLVAHLIFAGGDGSEVVDSVLAAYKDPTIDRALVQAFAGAELMRRTLGVSQLPLMVGLETKRGWLELSHQWVNAL
jgi:5-methylthioribose kinase